MSTYNSYIAAASRAQTPVTVINENKTIAPTPTNNPAAKNTTKQSKKYYCKLHPHIQPSFSITDHTHKGSYGKHGHNNSHDTKDCHLRKKIGHNLTYPAHPAQKVWKSTALQA
jgi:hypothetical protein